MEIICGMFVSAYTGAYKLKSRRQFGEKFCIVFNKSVSVAVFQIVFFFLLFLISLCLHWCIELFLVVQCKAFKNILPTLSNSEFQSNKTKKKTRYKNVPDLRARTILMANRLHSSFVVFFLVFFFSFYLILSLKLCAHIQWCSATQIHTSFNVYFFLFMAFRLNEKQMPTSIWRKLH